MSKKKINRSPEPWTRGEILGVLFVVVFIAYGIIIAPAIMGQDSVWFEFPTNEFIAEKKVCPECGDCVPKSIRDTAGVPLIYIINPCEHKRMLKFECQTMEHRFTVEVGGCNWIKWGKKIHPKDIDSLVDRQTGRLKDKKKGKGPK